MNIATARLHPYALPLRAAWRSAAGDLHERRGWLLEIIDDQGRSGWGECAPLPSHGSETHATAALALEEWRHKLPGRRVAEILARLASAGCNAAPAARAAVECALLDLLAQAAGQPLHAFLGDSTSHVEVNAIAGGVAGTESVADAMGAGYRVIKLKLGLDDAARELAALQALAATLPPGMMLRIDANRAWDAATAGKMLPALARLPVEAVEEPLSVADLDLLRGLQRDLPFALALDESLAGIDRESLWTDPPVRRLACKLAPLGGLLPALELARQAGRAGIECVITTGVDGACATLAAAHLAAALGNGLAHGLATSEWLESDIGRPPQIMAGMLTLPAAPGLGFAAGTTRPASALPSTG